MISLPQTDKSIDGKRILVTGAAGFIGSHLVESLQQSGANVLGVDRCCAQRTSELANSEAVSANPLRDAQSGARFPVAVQTLDLSVSADVFSVFEDFRPEYVYHLAFTPDGPEDFQQVMRTIDGGISITVNLLEAFRQYPGRLFVFGDSSKVYGDPGVSYRESLPVDPLSSYAIAKNTAWEFCKYHHRLYGSQVVSIRPTIVYGPGQPKNLIAYVIDELLHGRTKIKLLGGRQTRDPLHCDDLIRAYFALPGRAKQVANRVVNVGGSNEISVVDLVRMIAELMAVDVQVEIDDSQLRPTDSSRSFCNNEDAARLLDWRPEIDLESGLRQIIAASTEAFLHSGA